MADELSAAIERLRTSAQRLNSAVDAAGQLIRDVETFLDEAHVGLEACVRVQTHEYSKKLQTHWDLEYRRMDSGKYRVAVVIRHGRSSTPTAVRSWSECSREEKLSCIKKLPELIAELTKEVERRAEQAEKTVAAVAVQLPSVKPRKGG